MNRIEELYQRHGAMVLRRCRFLLRNEADAYDAMQDVFMAVFQKQSSLNADAGSSLLYRMATNGCLNRIRDRRLRDRHIAPGEADELINAIASSEDIEAATLGERMLNLVFGKQPESSRVIAVLHYVDGMTLEDVAMATGMSVSGVRKRLRKLSEIANELDGQ